MFVNSFPLRLNILSRTGFTYRSEQTKHFCQNEYISPFRFVSVFRKTVHEKRDLLDRSLFRFVRISETRLEHFG